MNLKNLITGICSLLFFMIGADKFLGFLEPPCSVMGFLPDLVVKFLGFMQLAAGVLVWLPKFRKPVIGFFFIFMIVFTIIHLVQNTSDVGGAVFMAVLLGLLVWNPGFIRGKSKG